MFAVCLNFAARTQLRCVHPNGGYAGPKRPPTAIYLVFHQAWGAAPTSRSCSRFCSRSCDPCVHAVSNGWYYGIQKSSKVSLGSRSFRGSVAAAADSGSPKSLLSDTLQKLVGDSTVQTQVAYSSLGNYLAVVQLPPILQGFFPDGTVFSAECNTKRRAQQAACLQVLMALQNAGVLTREHSEMLRALRSNSAILAMLPLCGPEGKDAAFGAAHLDMQAIKAFKAAVAHLNLSESDSESVPPSSVSPKQLLLEVLQFESRSNVRLTDHVQSQPCSGGLFQAEVHLPSSFVHEMDTQHQVQQQFLGIQRSKRDAEQEAALAALRALSQAGMLSPKQAAAVASLYSYVTVEENRLASLAPKVSADMEATGLPSEERLMDLQQAMQYFFADTNLLRRACRHPSILGVENNDRLAMLGDSVLNIVVLQEAMEQLPSAGQSDDKLMLMRYKVRRVSRAACAINAKMLGLDAAVVMGACFLNVDGSKTPNDNALAEAFEALIGAIFLDAGQGSDGLAAVAAFWQRLEEQPQHGLSHKP